MRILVVSDTHGDENGLHKVLLSQPKAEIVIHLGDGENDVEVQKYRFPQKMFLQVRGNCDWRPVYRTKGNVWWKAFGFSIPMDIFIR